MDDIYASARGSTQKWTVWRGIGKWERIDPELPISIAEVGDVTDERLPTSTSTNPAIGICFASKRILMKITIHEGVPIIVHNRVEMEVLIRHGYRQRIDRIDFDVPVWEQGQVSHRLEKVIQATIKPKAEWRASGLVPAPENPYLKT